jgi:HEAT repeat protein
MRRLALILVTIGFPVTAAAQTPPARPVPQAPPVPTTAPTPMVPPRAVIAPLLDVSWPEISTIAAQEATWRAQEALEHARVAMAPMALHLDDFRYEFGHDWQMNQFGQNDSSYSSCLSYVSQRKYEEAIARCDRVISAKGTRADSALYWKAYAQYQLKKNDDALATINQLRRDYAQSRYMQDAKVLENDVRRVDPSTQTDPDLKLLAIQAMQHAEPERAIPLLEGVLNSTNLLSVKRRALYVLAQSTQPRAHQIILNLAKGQGNPDLQLEAIRYIQTNKDRQTTARELREVYDSTTDVNVRRAVIDAYTQTWNVGALVSIAGAGSTPMPVRQQAVSGLSSVASPTELWALYSKETDKDLRLHMVSAFASMQALDQLTQIVKTEKEPTVRARAIRALGSMRAEKTGQMLADLYGSDQDVEVRRAVISALSSQNNAEGLVAIARKEASLPLKTLIVQKLSEMAPRSKVAADYMMEIIK